jgi:hypothetical protein
MEPWPFLRWADRPRSPFDRTGLLSLGFALLFVIVALSIAVW